MKIWNVKDQSAEHEIEMGEITVLNGQHIQWHNLIRSIDNYFNTRQSQIQLYEDNLPVNKKDWQCFMIPFDAEVQLNKITAKSPLKEVQSNISEQIAYSGFFQELQEVWDQLNDELQLINKQMASWGLTSILRPFEEKDINDFIKFHATDNSSLSPIAIKILLLNLILKRPFDKKTLIIIELPDLYANKEELTVLHQLMEKAIQKGYQFLIVSHEINQGVLNYYYEGTIINDVLLEKMKSKVQQEVPFHCSDELYEKAKNTFIQLVDNSISKESLMKQNKNNGPIITIIHIIMYNLNIGSLHSVVGLESNLMKFIADYH